MIRAIRYLLMTAVHTSAHGARVMLATLAELGFALEAPILAAASPSLMGAANARALASPEDWSAPSEAFQQLRHSPAAPYLGLLLPRFLLRAPYGRDGEECELRGFEELESASADEDLLWGSPAVAAAMLLGRAFADAGWEMRPGAHREIERLPLVHREGEPVPSAEVWLTESAAERILDRGVMPVASVRHSDSAHRVRFQSIASPAAPLAGRWTTSRP